MPFENDGSVYSCRFVIERKKEKKQKKRVASE